MPTDRKGTLRPSGAANAADLASLDGIVVSHARRRSGWGRALGTGVDPEFDVVFGVPYSVWQPRERIAFDRHVCRTIAGVDHASGFVGGLPVPEVAVVVHHPQPVEAPRRHG
jgi:hypothetical protein